MARKPKELSDTTKERLNTIGKKLTKERQSVDNNYKTFAENHGMNNMTLWRMQQGEDFSMSTLIQALDAIGITLEDFFNGIK